MKIDHIKTKYKIALAFILVMLLTQSFVFADSSTYSAQLIAHDLRQISGVKGIAPNNNYLVGSIAYQAGQPAKAFILENGALSLLPVDDDPSNESIAFAVNDSRIIVGVSRSSGGSEGYPFVYDALNGKRALPLRCTPSANAPCFAAALAINNHGVIVGYAFDNQNKMLPAKWTPDSGTYTLSLPYFGGDYRVTRAVDINNEGLILGTGIMSEYVSMGVGTEVNVAVVIGLNNYGGEKLKSGFEGEINDLGHSVGLKLNENGDVMGWRNPPQTTPPAAPNQNSKFVIWKRLLTCCNQVYGSPQILLPAYQNANASFRINGMSAAGDMVGTYLVSSGKQKAFLLPAGFTAPQMLLNLVDHHSPNYRSLLQGRNSLRVINNALTMGGDSEMSSQNYLTFFSRIPKSDPCLATVFGGLKASTETASTEQQFDALVNSCLVAAPVPVANK